MFNPVTMIARESSNQCFENSLNKSGMNMSLANRSGLNKSLCERSRLGKSASMLNISGVLSSSVVSSGGRSSKSLSRSRTGLMSNSNGHDDRYMPRRQSGSDMAMSSYLATNQVNTDYVPDNSDSPRTAQNKKLMSRAILGEHAGSRRILNFRKGAPENLQGYRNEQGRSYRGTSTDNRQKERYIPADASRVLDAPDIYNDFYLNIIDWGSHNVLGVGLKSLMWLWNAENGTITELCDLRSKRPNTYIASVRWMQGGSCLAIGTSDAMVELWDPTKGKKLRSLGGHTNRVATLAWNQWLLISGNKAGGLHMTDVRVNKPYVHKLKGHAQEICGLGWSSDSRHFASGGNDDKLLIWDTMMASNGRALREESAWSTPILTFDEHTAAVKAVEWCPWHDNILATGGGVGDRSMKFWNIASGRLLKTVDCGSQVAGVVWNERYRELVTGHGFSKNEISIWKYPHMEKIRELRGHDERILNICANPDKSTVVSSSSDETIRIWHIWPHNPEFEFRGDSKVGSKTSAGAAKVTPATDPTFLPLSNSMNKMCLR